MAHGEKMLITVVVISCHGYKYQFFAKKKKGVPETPLCLLSGEGNNKRQGHTIIICIWGLYVVLEFL